MTNQQPLFDTYVGIDYSGAGRPTSAQKGIQVFMAERDNPPTHVRRPDSNANWSRKGLAGWLAGALRSRQRAIVGIDHAFSFPQAYMERYGISDWSSFLADFYRHWPTDRLPVAVVREGNARYGNSTWFRLTDRWTPSAKSVFLFGVNGEVATSTHAGIPWLHHLRQESASKIHFWPFEGFLVPAGVSAIVEVYPSLFRHRYETALFGDELDAFAVCRWLQDRDRQGLLASYFEPPLSPEERETARLEGWMLGLM